MLQFPILLPPFASQSVTRSHSQHCCVSALPKIPPLHFLLLVSHFLHSLAFPPSVEPGVGCRYFRFKFLFRRSSRSEFLSPSSGFFLIYANPHLPCFFFPFLFSISFLCISIASFRSSFFRFAALLALCDLILDRGIMHNGGGYLASL